MMKGGIRGGTIELQLCETGGVERSEEVQGICFVRNVLKRYASLFELSYNVLHLAN